MYVKSVFGKVFFFLARTHWVIITLLPGLPEAWTLYTPGISPKPPPLECNKGAVICWHTLCQMSTRDFGKEDDILYRSKNSWLIIYWFFTQNLYSFYDMIHIAGVNRISPASYLSLESIIVLIFSANQTKPSHCAVFSFITSDLKMALNNTMPPYIKSKMLKRTLKNLQWTMKNRMIKSAEQGLSF